MISNRYHIVIQWYYISTAYLCLRSVIKRRCTSIVSFKNWFYAEQNNFHGAVE